MTRPASLRIVLAYFLLCLLSAGIAVGVAYARPVERLAELPRVYLNTAIPTASFIYACDPAPARSCTFASTSTGTPVRHFWTWGNGSSESHVSHVARNTWPASGTYIVALTITDALGASSTATQQVRVPVQATTIAHDTIQIVATVPLPLASASYTIIDSLLVGQPIRVFSCALNGMLNRRAGSQVMAFRDSASARFTTTNGPLTIGVFREAGLYPTLATAVAGLLAPPPVGWVP